MLLDGNEVEINLNGKIYHCALDVTMEYIGGKWKTVVLWYLRKDTRRFSELKRLMPDITEKMLSLQLKQLEKDGVIKRTIFAEVPPRVEYCLIQEGKTLLPILDELAKWGRWKSKVAGNIQEVMWVKKGKMR